MTPSSSRTEVSSARWRDALHRAEQWLPVGSTLHAVASGRPLHRGRARARGACGRDGAIALILDNESARPARVLVRGVSTAQMALLSASQAGLPTRNVTSPTAQVPLSLASNEIVALTARP